MAEVLSQSQIDALLNSMQSSDKQEAKPEKKKQNYRKYDFYSPKKFTKDRLKLVRGIYENYARIVSSRLNGILRVSSEIEVLTVEEQRYYEFSNALSDSDIMMLSDLKLQDDSKNPPLITHINQILMVNMIDRMLGGLGDDTEIDAYYTYTEIELSLYRRIMSYILGATKEAWSNYIKLDIGDERLEENPSLFQEISLDEPVAIVMLNVKMGNIEGKVSVCIPGNLLTSIFSIIDRRKHVESDYVQDTKRTREAILSKIKDSALTVYAELGEAQVSLRDVCGLKVGDVLDLNKSKNSNISLFVDKEPWFEGKAGTHKKNVAIKIQKRIGADDEEEGALQAQGAETESENRMIQEEEIVQPELTAQPAEEPAEQQVQE